MPEEFIKDMNVPIRWRIWAILNGFFINRQKCWASNEWLGEHVEAHKDSVSQGVKELEKMGVIKCERTRRTRTISPMFSKPEIGDTAYQEGAVPPISDRRHRLSVSDSISDSLITRLENVDSSNSIEETTEVSIDEDGNPIPPRKSKGKDQVAVRVSAYFFKEAEKLSGRKFIDRGYTQVKKMLSSGNVVEKDLIAIIDDFFDKSPSDESVANIYKCLSPMSINKYLSVV